MIGRLFSCDRNFFPGFSFIEVKSLKTNCRKEKAMKKITLLATGLVLGFSLYGCGGNDGGQAVSLQDIAMDMSKEGNILPGAQEEDFPKSAQGEIQPGGISGETGTVSDTQVLTRESTQPAVNPAAGDVHNRAVEEIKDYLAQYPDSLQELSEEECYVILHGKEYSGREYLNSFMGNVQTDVPDELVIVQFTVEGDPILYYLNANDENIYCMEDASRDAWAGNGERYFEKTYDSVWLSGEMDTEGNYYMSLYALQEQDMIVEVFTAATDEPLLCGYPTAESFMRGQTMSSQPQTESESKLPRIEDLASPSEEGGNCVELHDLPEWAKPPAP